MKHKLYNIKGKRYAKSGELETSISFYEKAISIKPEYVDAHYNLGSVNHKLGRLDSAVTSYKKVVAISPNYAKTHNNKILSVIYFFSKPYLSLLASFTIVRNLIILIVLLIPTIRLEM